MHIHANAHAFRAVGKILSCIRYARSFLDLLKTNGGTEVLWEACLPGDSSTGSRSRRLLVKGRVMEGAIEYYARIKILF